MRGVIDKVIDEWLAHVAQWPCPNRLGQRGSVPPVGKADLTASGRHVSALGRDVVHDWEISVGDVKGGKSEREKFLSSEKAGIAAAIGHGEADY